MARKNLLSGLTNGELPAGNSVNDPVPQAVSPTEVPSHFGLMGARGAIGAVTRSIEQLKSQSIVELDPALIEPSFISDRLRGFGEGLSELMESMREHGQQVPILVRPHPARAGHYQIAYGHRRLKAATELECKVRAVVKPLTDKQLVVAQGQENSTRTDLSFIEKALFAAKLEEAGFDRETIMASLSVDKTGLSRLISTAVKIPREIIEAIGPAPKAGRDRWLELSARLDQQGTLEAAQERLSKRDFTEASSDERFNKLFDALTRKKLSTARPRVWKSEDGKRIGRIKDDEHSVTVVVDKKVAAKFGAYLIEALPDIYAAFKCRVEE
jgi:ParB family chromosome partitioning protein